MCQGVYIVKELTRNLVPTLDVSILNSLRVLAYGRDPPDSYARETLLVVPSGLFSVPFFLMILTI